MCVYFTTGTGHSLFAWITLLLYKFSKLHGNLISDAALCILGELGAMPEAESHICDDFPSPSLPCTPHLLLLLWSFFLFQVLEWWGGPS